MSEAPLLFDDGQAYRTAKLITGTVSFLRHNPDSRVELIVGFATANAVSHYIRTQAPELAARIVYRPQWRCACDWSGQLSEVVATGGYTAHFECPKCRARIKAPEGEW